MGHICSANKYRVEVKKIENPVNMKVFNNFEFQQ
jgi:hypothetical protein